jgi:hypothetical protein
MGDHARFIFFSLAPTETEYILTAQEFIITFDELLQQSHEQLSQNDIFQLNQNAFNTLCRLREFKLELLRMSITSDLKSHLPPTFINDMLNELEEYQLILNAFLKGQSPLFHPLHYHILWLTDAIGHAATITSTLDPIEKEMIAKAYDYEMQFNDLYFKAFIMNGYLRTQLKQFPSLERLNNEANVRITDFMEFLENLRDQRTDQKILGTLMPLMADHMSREECYYLWKLSQTTETIRKPDCDPARPRVEA